MKRGLRKLIIREIFTTVKKIDQIIMYQFFSNLSHVYAYLFVNFSEDKYHNFFQNMDILHQCFKHPKIKSSLNPEVSRLKDERRESPSSFTKSAILVSSNFATFRISQICTSFNMSLSYTVLERESTLL